MTKLFPARIKGLYWEGEGEGGTVLAMSDLAAGFVAEVTALPGV